MTAAADKLRSLLAEARMVMMEIPAPQFESVTRPILTGFAASVKELLGQTRGGGMPAGAGPGGGMPGRGGMPPGPGGGVVGGGVPRAAPMGPM